MDDDGAVWNLESRHRESALEPPIRISRLGDSLAGCLPLYPHLPPCQVT